VFSVELLLPTVQISWKVVRPCPPREGTTNVASQAHAMLTSSHSVVCFAAQSFSSLSLLVAAEEEDSKRVRVSKLGW
jgi:hypothetical protein